MVRESCNWGWVLLLLVLLLKHLHKSPSQKLLIANAGR
jgi:hypothetical protein